MPIWPVPLGILVCLVAASSARAAQPSGPDQLVATPTTAASATAASATAASATTKSSIGVSIEPAPYRPYRDGDPLPAATLPPPDDEVLQPPGPTYERRAYQPMLGLSLLPLWCAEQRDQCQSYGAHAGLAVRPAPHFAWTVSVQRTKLRRLAVHYLALGARVYALDSGMLDPHLELNLGAEHWSHAPRLNVAFELSFGLGLRVAEHLQLGPALRLRHGQRRTGTCDEYGTGCRSWSSTGERWLEAGVVLEVPLGQRH